MKPRGKQDNIRIFDTEVIMSVMTRKQLVSMNEIYKLANFMLNMSLKSGTLVSVLPILTYEIRRQLSFIAYFSKERNKKLLETCTVEVISDYFRTVYGKQQMIKRISDEHILQYFGSIAGLNAYDQGHGSEDEPTTRAMLSDRGNFSSGSEFHSEKYTKVIVRKREEVKAPSVPPVTDITFQDFEDKEFEEMAAITTEKIN